MIKAADKIVLRPIITEKCTDLREKQNIYTFEVNKDATKQEIKQVVEKQYGVKVEHVNTINIKGKIKIRRMIEGKRRDKKKAFVKIKKGDKIPIFEGV